PTVDLGHSATATLTVAVPNIPIFRYNVGAIIDSADVIMEGTEQNNTVFAPSTFLLGSDLEGSFPTGAVPLPPAGTGSVSFGLVNHSSALGSVGYRVYLSTDSVVSANDQLIAQGTAATTARGTTVVNTLGTVAPIAVGLYNEILVVDPDNLIPEVDEG